MASDQQLAANRRNVRKSTGPASDSGKRTSRVNALRHGLATRLDRDPILSVEAEKMADIFSRARGGPIGALNVRDAAEAEIHLLRIGKIRVSIYATFYRSARSLEDLTQLNEELRKLDRYERRAYSRRRRALIWQNEPKYLKTRT